MNKQERLEIVRSAVAQATTGLAGQDYRDFMEELLADAEGWRMEIEETKGEDDAAPITSGLEGATYCRVFTTQTLLRHV
jgi:hypothetical protein